MFERLPELDTVAFGIRDPGEVAVGGALALGVDGDTRGLELCEQGFEVVDAVVDHAGLGGWDVRAFRGKKHPGRLSGAGGYLVGPEEVGSAVFGEWNAQVLDVPGLESLGIASLEKDAANAGDAGHR